MNRFFRFLTRVLGRSTPARKTRPTFARAACQVCGRTVAHTRTGKAWDHICITPEVSK